MSERENVTHIFIVLYSATVKNKLCYSHGIGAPGIFILSKIIQPGEYKQAPHFLSSVGPRFYRYIDYV